MDVISILQNIKAHPEYRNAGMVLIHNGTVRATSRKGMPVSTLVLKPDRAKLNEIVTIMKKRTGIIEIIAEVNEGTLVPGDDIMIIAVAGDYRENVFPVLRETIELVKSNVTEKLEM